jgi:type II secretory pathway component PulC
MKKWQTIILVAALAGMPLVASAADSPAPTPTAQPAPGATPAPDAKSQEQLEQELEQARQKLQEAARQVADLSMQLNGDPGRTIEVVRDRMEKLQHRGILGVDLNDDDENSKSPGAVLSGVSPGGPADKAGLHAGDVVTSINGTAFKPSGDDTAADKLVDFMRNVKPGDSLKVAYTRDGKANTATVTAGSLRDMGFAFFTGMPPVSPMAPMPPMAPMAPDAPRVPMPRMFGFNNFFGMGGPWGDMQLVNMSPGLGQYFGTDKGLLVLHTTKDSALQLQDGDVILAIGGRDPGSAPHAMRILSSYGPGESVKIDIMRKGKPVTLSVTLPKAGDDSTSNAFYYKVPDMGNDNDGDDGR